jgi:hypothetical protein
MAEKLVRIGTTYIPVTKVDISADWYVNKLGAELSYKDHGKVKLELERLKTEDTLEEIFFL